MLVLEPHSKTYAVLAQRSKIECEPGVIAISSTCEVSSQGSNVYRSQPGDVMVVNTNDYAVEFCVQPSMEVVIPNVPETRAIEGLIQHVSKCADGTVYLCSKPAVQHAIFSILVHEGRNVLYVTDHLILRSRDHTWVAWRDADEVDAFVDGIYDVLVWSPDPGMLPNNKKLAFDRHIYVDDERGFHMSRHPYKEHLRSGTDFLSSALRYVEVRSGVRVETAVPRAPKSCWPIGQTRSLIPASLMKTETIRAMVPGTVYRLPNMVVKAVSESKARVLIET